LTFLINAKIPIMPKISFTESSETELFSAYIPCNEHSQGWGGQITTVGASCIQPGQIYPPGKHPEAYLFSQDKGRTLPEYQMVYISRGQGQFWSQSAGEQLIRSGCLFILFPNERHRYQPDPSMGWNEQWIGMSGLHISQLMGAFFNRHQPIIQIHDQAEMVHLFQAICNLAKNRQYGYVDLLMAKTMEIIARARIADGSDPRQSSEHDKVIQKALNFSSEDTFLNTDYEAFALANGMSYSNFRRIFKEQTGVAPHQFLLDIKIRKAKNLMVNTNLSVSEVALAAGFNNFYYFSRYFKKCTGLSPMNYRQKMQ
jgi:AraC-like DNA-binding protein